MEKTLIAISMVAAGLCTLAAPAKKDNNISPKQQTAVISPVKHINVDPKMGDVFKTGSKTPDTSKNKIQLYKPSDFKDGTTMKVLAGVNGRRQLAYLFKRKGVLYQVFMNNGDPTALYINGEEKALSYYQDKIDALIEEYRKITPPLPLLPPLGPVKPMTITAPSLPAVPVIQMEPMAPMPQVQMPPLPAMPPIAPLPPLKPDANLMVVTNALIKQGIIKDEDSYDLTINDKYLTVDGVKQSEELHQRMLKKLMKKPGDKVKVTFSYHK